MLDDKAIKKIRKLTSVTDHNSTTALKALSDINRYRIFRILADHSNLSVSDIAKILEISKPLASIHIKILQRAGLVQKERSGQKICPRLELKNPFVRAVIQMLIQTSKK